MTNRVLVGPVKALLGTLTCHDACTDAVGLCDSCSVGDGTTLPVTDSGHSAVGHWPLVSI